MSDHEQIRAILALAAAGALDDAEELRVTEHLARCAACAAEMQAWQGLADGLRGLPTPQAPAALVERTRAQATAVLVWQAETRQNQGVLACLVVFAWALALASGPVTGWLGRTLFGWAEPPAFATWPWLAGTAALVWLSGGALAVLLALRRRAERSLA